MKKRILTYLMLSCFPFLLIAQWTNNPIVNTKISDTTGAQVLPKIAVNADNGESYISWFSNAENQQYDVYMQRLDVNGNKMWAEDGLLISNHPTMSWVTDYDLVVDHEGCAILVTQDERTGNSDVYAYRISPDGDFLWGDDGIALTNDPDFNPSPKALVDQNGNIIVEWGGENNDTFSKVYLQKLSKEGEALWSENTVISSDSMHILMPNIIGSEDTGTIVVWVETVTTDTAEGYWPKMYAYAQKIDHNGNLAWVDKVAIDTAENMPLAFFDPSIISDGNKGFFVSWMAYPEGLNYTSYVQHVNSDGMIQWAPNGINVSDSIQYRHGEPSLTYYAQDEELLVFWNEWRKNNDGDEECAIFGQKFSDAGDVQWTNGGEIFDGWYSYFDTLTSVLGISPATENDFSVFFSKEYWEISPDTLLVISYSAMRLDKDGNFGWVNEKPLIASSGSIKSSFTFSDLVSSQWIVAWDDNRNNPQSDQQTGIYAQNISIDGVLGIITGIDETKKFASNSITNYPNPFHNQTTIEYELPQSGNVNLSLTDVNGRQVRQLFTGKKQKGTHTFDLNASGLSQGMYFVYLKFDGSISYHKIMVE